MKKKAIFTLILIFLLLVVVEVLCLVAGKVILKVSSGGVLYTSSQVSYAEYIERVKPKMNPVLGWPAHTEPMEKTFYVPAKDSGRTKVSVYGDSFANSISNELDNKWSSLVAKEFGLNLDNYGVSGYGTDQAYLRYRSNKNDSSEVVILNHFVGDLTRNLLQRFFWQHTNFKPILLLEGDSLRYVPPTILANENEFEEYVSAPGKHLPHDWMAPGNEYGPAVFGFPYSVSLVKALFSKNNIHKLTVDNSDGELAYRRFYRMEYPTQLTAKIIVEFCELAKSRGQRPIVTIMPASGDFEYFSLHEEWGHETLLTLLEENGIEYLDYSPELYDRHTPTDMYRELYDETHHFNKEGEALCASIFGDFVREKAILAQ